MPTMEPVTECDFCGETHGEECPLFTCEYCQKPATGYYYEAYGRARCCDECHEELAYADHLSERQCYCNAPGGYCRC